jgi:hypothetical protein
MLYNELTERLTDTVTSSLLGHFIEVIIGKIKLIPNLSSICSEALPRSNSLSWVVSPLDIKVQILRIAAITYLSDAPQERHHPRD